MTDMSVLEEACRNVRGDAWVAIPTVGAFLDRYEARDGNGAQRIRREYARLMAEKERGGV